MKKQWEAVRTRDEHHSSHAGPSPKKIRWYHFSEYSALKRAYTSPDRPTAFSPTIQLVIQPSLSREFVQALLMQWLIPMTKFNSPDRDPVPLVVSYIAVIHKEQEGQLLLKVISIMCSSTSWKVRSNPPKNNRMDIRSPHQSGMTGIGVPSIVSNLVSLPLVIACVVLVR